MSIRMLRGRRCAVSALMLAFPLFSPHAFAHGFAGDRFFPATIIVDDPFVADELSLPTVQKSQNGDGVQEIDVSADISKRITDHFGVSIGENWTNLKPGTTGFQNLDTTFIYQLFTDAKHEFVFSAGLGLEWGNTGAKGVGADNFNTYTPEILFGKGFGDLPEEFGLIRPFAFTGQLGYALPGLGKKVTESLDPNGVPVFDVERHPDVFNWGLTLQYSLPYLNSNVKAIEGPGSEFLKHLIPLVEASFTTPVANFTGRAPTTGTINPGVIWVGQYTQFGVEAVIPVNRDSGRGVGAIGQLHFYLDDIFPNGIGQPLFKEERP